MVNHRLRNIWVVDDRETPTVLPPVKGQAMFGSNSPKNLLIAAMRDDDVRALLEQSETVELTVNDNIEQPNVPFEHVYFPDRGVVSVVVSAPDGKRIEAGLIGREGVTGFSAAQSADQSPHQTFVQMKGRAIRVKVGVFRRALDQSSHLRQLIGRYGHTFNTQIAYTALANGKATIEERLGRWLLMCQDRIGDPNLELTHEFLALMLGTRRPGVTDALHMLEGKHLIKSTRGTCLVTDRKGLIDLVGGIYGVPEAEYDRLVGTEFKEAVMETRSDRAVETRTN
jgi:CRP-like cAMP-binding protein